MQAFGIVEADDVLVDVAPCLLVVGVLSRTISLGIYI
jgi:hypothetical protein